jgi:gluconate 5-dehydrogenase
VSESARLTNEKLGGLFDLTGKTAVVTGAAGILGGFLAKGLALYGADVCLTDLGLPGLAPVVAEIESYGRRAITVACDVTDHAGVQAMMDAAIAELGKVDILVACAGINSRDVAEVLPIEEFDRVMGVNVRGTFLCCQAAARHMIGQSGGKIITIGSVRGFVGSPGGSASYTTAKGAVHLLTKQLATEWARYKINVNSIAPTVFRTPLTEDLLEDEEASRWVLSRIPWGRTAEVDDFLGAAIFLASAASDYVTGFILSVDGGCVAG